MRDVLRLARVRWFVVATAAVLACAAAGQAAEPLEWRFKRGDEHRYRTSLELESTMDLGEAGREVRTLRHAIEMTWTVQDLTDDGQAVITQKIDRVEVKLSSPDEQPVEYDSSAAGEPSGFAAMIAPLGKAMVGSELEITMTPRGEVTAVEAPAPLVEALKNAPGAAMLGELATEKGLEKLVQTMSLRLPEDFTDGVEWTTTLETKNELLGVQTCETSYRHQETRDVDGDQVEVFEPKVLIKFEDSPSSIDVVDEESSGEVLFNRTARRLESSTVKHSMTLKIGSQGRQIEQEIDQTTKLERLPDDKSL